MPSRRGCAVNSQRSGELRRRNLLPPSMPNHLWGPRPAEAGRGGKKKMRSLGTVQMPTEAFMAVLKLDEE